MSDQYGLPRFRFALTTLPDILDICNLGVSFETTLPDILDMNNDGTGSLIMDLQLILLCIFLDFLDLTHYRKFLILAFHSLFSTLHANFYWSSIRKSTKSKRYITNSLQLVNRYIAFL